MVVATEITGWASLMWGVIVALVYALAWLFRLEGRVNTAAELALAQQKTIERQFEGLAADLARRYDENRGELQGLRGDLQSVRAVLLQVAIGKKDAS